MHSKDLNNIHPNLENLKLTPHEQKLFDLFFEDYEYQFENILKTPEKKLFNILYNHITSLIGKIKLSTYSKLSITKVQTLLQTKYYLEDLKTSKNFINYLNTQDDKKKVLSELEIKNIKPHCKNCKKTNHSCGEKIYYNEEYDYVICIKCNEIYYPSLIHLYCEECEEEYYSNIIEKENKIGDFELATWEKYHCKPQLENNMKCQRCNEDLYFSQNKKILKCFNCNWKNRISNMIWICDNCNEKFYSECKIYNKLDNITQKICVRNALVNNFYAKPEQISCCKIENNKFLFQHNFNCDGYLIYGILNKKKVLVCNKCYDINKIENFNWLCPKCNKSFVCIVSKKINHIKGKSENNINKNFNQIKPTVPNLLRKIKNDLKINNNDILIDSTDRIYKINVSPNPYNQRNKIKHIFSDPIQNSPSARNRNVGVINKNYENNNLIYNYNYKSRNNVNELYDFSGSNYLSNSKSNKNNLIKTQDSIKFNSSNPKNLRKEIKINSVEKKKLNPNQSTEKLRKTNSGLINISSLNKIDNSILKNINYQILNNNNNNNNNDNNIIKNNILNQIPRRPKTKSINGIRVNMNNINLNINVNFNINNLLNTKIHLNIEPNENIKPEEYEIDKLVGEGTYGKTYSVIWIKNNKKYALKKIISSKKTEIEQIKDQYNLIFRFIKKTKCNGVIKIYGDKIEQNENNFTYYVLMELALTDWEKEINERNNIKKYYTESELLEIIKILVKTFSQLQKNNICHRDIKPQNILIFNNNNYKIADFGEAKTIRQGGQIHTIRGTELYMSPILFRALKMKRNQVLHNSFKSDVFSLGMCIFQSCTLSYKNLFYIRELKDMESIKSILVRYLISRYSNEFIDILLKMIEIDEKKRFDFIELENFLFHDN